MSHTEGKLETRGFYAVNERGRAVFDCGPVPMKDEEIKANARRLVACWNACTEIPTDTLEMHGFRTILADLQRQINDQWKERDELLAALLSSYNFLQGLEKSPDKIDLCLRIGDLLAKYQETE